jgi:GTP 3',8-cyclase
MTSLEQTDIPAAPTRCSEGPRHPSTAAPGSAPDLGAEPTYAYFGGPNLYINLTSRCSSNCSFCLREFTWEVFGRSLWLAPDDEPDAQTVIAAIQESLSYGASAGGPKEVVFTGIGEPTLRLDVMLEVLQWLSGRGLASRLDTNGHGQLLNPQREVAEELAASGLKAASVSLNAADAATYERLCRPGVRGAFPGVLDFIRRLVEAGVETTATMVDIDGVEHDAVRDLASELGAAFRVRPLICPDRPVPDWPRVTVGVADARS